MKSITPAKADTFQASLISWSNSLLSSLATSVSSLILFLKSFTSLQVYNTTYLRGCQWEYYIFLCFREIFSRNASPKKFIGNGIE